MDARNPFIADFSQSDGQRGRWAEGQGQFASWNQFLSRPAVVVVKGTVKVVVKAIEVIVTAIKVAGPNIFNGDLRNSASMSAIGTSIN